MREDMWKYLLNRNRSAMRAHIMLRLRRTFILALLQLLFIFWIFYPAFAAESQESQPQSISLNLQDAIQRALQYYEKVALSQADVEIARGNTWQAYALALPSLRGSYNYTRNIEKPSLFFNTGKVPLGFDNAHSFEIDLSQPVTRFGGIYYGIDAARKNRAAAGMNLQQTRADVIYETREAYFQALLAQGQMTLAHTSLEEANQIARSQNLRMKIGEISDFEAQRSALSAQTRQTDLLQAESNHEIALARLKRIAGILPSEILKLTHSLEDSVQNLESENQLKDQIHSSPKVAFAKLRAQSLNQTRKATRANFFPNMNIFGFYKRTGESSDRFFPNSNEFSNNLALGLKVDVPIFDGLLTAGKYKVAQARAQQAEWEKNLIEKDLQLSLEQTLAQAKSQQLKKINAQQNLKLAQTLYHQAQLRFENGLSSYLDLKDIQTQLEQARLNYLSSVYDYVLSLAKLDQLTGSTNTHD